MLEKESEKNALWSPTEGLQVQSPDMKSGAITSLSFSFFI